MNQQFPFQLPPFDPEMMLRPWEAWTQGIQWMMEWQRACMSWMGEGGALPMMGFRPEELAMGFPAEVMKAWMPLFQVPFGAMSAALPSLAPAAPARAAEPRVAQAAGSAARVIEAVLARAAVAPAEAEKPKAAAKPKAKAAAKPARPRAASTRRGKPPASS